MHRPALVHIFTALAPALPLAGCMHLAMPDLPDTVPSRWTQVAEAAPDASTVDLKGWWKQFADPQLDALVEQAIAGNQSLAQAAGRLQQARQLAGGAGKAYRPQLSALAKGAEEISSADTYYQANLNLIWELGLFGEREGVLRQAQGNVGLATAALQGARVAVVAETVRNYLELRAAQQQIGLLEQQAQLDRRALTLLEVRIANRLAAPQEREQLQFQRAQTLAALSEPRLALARAEHALAALLGQTRPDPAWRQACPLPRLLIGAPSQLPADLLRSRPDVRDAEAQVLRAVGDLGVARARLYPRLAIGSSYLYAYNLTQNTRAVHNDVPMLGPIIDLPLLDWGLRRDAVQAQRQALQAALAGYRQAVLDGVAQVETGLALLSLSRDKAKHLREAGATMRQQAEQGMVRMRLGLSSEWEQLAVQRAQLQAEQATAEAEAGQALAFVTLYRALGGAPLPAGNGGGDGGEAAP